MTNVFKKYRYINIIITVAKLSELSQDGLKFYNTNFDRFYSFIELQLVISEIFHIKKNLGNRKVYNENTFRIVHPA